MGIQEDINELKNIVKELSEDKNNVEKKFKYPFGKKVGKGQKRKNYVTVLILNENGVVDWKKYQITDQTLTHDLIPRLATAGHVMFDKKGNPLVILPSWSTEPFSPLEHYKRTLKEGTNTNAHKVLLAKMKMEQVSGKKQMGNALKWILGIGLAVIIGYAFLTGGGA